MTRTRTLRPNQTLHVAPDGTEFIVEGPFPERDGGETNYNVYDGSAASSMNWRFLRRDGQALTITQRPLNDTYWPDLASALAAVRNFGLPQEDW